MKKERKPKPVERAIGTFVSLALMFSAVGAVWAWNQAQKPGGNHSPLIRRAVSVMSTLDAVVPTLTPTPTQTPTPVPPTATPTPSPKEIARQVFVLTNAERKAHGVSPMAWDDHLAAVAQWRAEDMVKRHYFSHYDPVTGRVLAAEKIHGEGSENIVAATGPEPSVGGPNLAWARLFVTSWMHSPEHRENMLNPRWGKLGVGIACGGGKCYGVQVFTP